MCVRGYCMSIHPAKEKGVLTYICVFRQIEGFILSKLSARDLLQRSQATPPLLSPEEQVFARDFAEIVDKHFKNLALQHMPSNMSTVSGKASE